MSNYESNLCNFCVKNVLSGIFDTLTPGHFLVGHPITAIAEPSLTEVSDNRLKVWKKQTKIVQQIWKRWSNNYFSTLQNRNKWYFEKNNVKIHDMESPQGTLENIQMAVTDQLEAIPISEFHQCYEEWKKRLQRCVASEGSYFEGDNVEL
ncbi:DUF5641 domain-containing protein [Trichonephila clavipes]|nr:DUF5641 domain-containing protein [Trichonephila clavipes]